MQSKPSPDPQAPDPVLQIGHGHFVDASGRIRMLRGVNLGGSSKLPFGYGHIDPIPSAAEFFDHARTVSFVNRPFPLEDADVHFARLKRWGLTCLRVIVTWEAIEHEGPGIYDQAYLEYIRKLVQKADEYGLVVFLDPHQDVWSRWTGGDGAPMWTLECIGLEPRHFDVTQSALCLETQHLASAADFPKMVWPSNYFKFACATMFTLFFAGERFAPSCHVEGVQVQEYLQSHYLNAIAQLAKAVAGLRNVIGYDVMNEPSAGFVGVQDLGVCFGPLEPRMDIAPTPFEGMCLASGYPQRVKKWSLGFRQLILHRPDKLVGIDPKGTRAWKDDARCVWAAEGVWDVDAMGQPRLCKPQYFANADFRREFYVPFVARFARVIHDINPNAMIFMEMPAMEFAKQEFPDIDPVQVPNAVNASHWYDAITLALRAWRPNFTVDIENIRPVFGYAAVHRAHSQQLRQIKASSEKQMHNAPTLIGETGIPFNLSEGQAYRTGDYKSQVAALNHTMSVLEANLVSFTLWCYAADNCNAFGDTWNLEDLSIVSEDHVKDNVDKKHPSPGDAAARGQLAFQRPYATKIAGVPSRAQFDSERREFVLEFSSNSRDLQEQQPTQAPTELYVPHCQYPKGFNVEVSDGEFKAISNDGYDTILFHHSDTKTEHRVRIVSQSPPPRNNHGMLVAVLAVVLLAVIIFFLVRK